MLADFTMNHRLADAIGALEDDTEIWAKRHRSNIGLLKDACVFKRAPHGC